MHGSFDIDVEERTSSPDACGAYTMHVFSPDIRGKVPLWRVMLWQGSRTVSKKKGKEADRFVCTLVWLCRMKAEVECVHYHCSKGLCI